MSRSERIKAVAYYGSLLGIALLLGWLERLLPPPVPSLPGVKLGLANALVLFVMYRNGIGAASALNFARVMLCGFLFGGMSGILYSLAGALLSTAAMHAVKKISKTGILAASTAGAVMHNAGQLAVACAVMSSPAPLYYLPWLTIAGVLAGILTGTAAGLLLKRLPGRV